MSQTSSERFGISAAVSASKTPDGVDAEAPELFGGGASGGKAVTAPVNIYACCKDDNNTEGGDDDDDTGGASGKAEGSFEKQSSESSKSESSSEFDAFARTKKESEAASKIASKNIRITEVNIGGLPSADWREWAASVKEKPMPISYDLVGLWNLMDNALAESFFEAYTDLEALEALYSNSGPYLDAMHFGVSRGSGEPLSTYSSDPNVDFRALLRVDQIEAAVSEAMQDLKVVGETFQPRVDRPLGKDLVACGVQVTRDDTLENKVGVTALSLKFCSASNWYHQSDWLRIGKNTAEPKGDHHEGDCPDNQFIDGMRVRYCGDSDCGEKIDTPIDVALIADSTDALGIFAIQTTCNVLGGSESTRTIQDVFCIQDSDRSETQTDCGSDAEWEEWIFLPPTKSTGTTNVIVGASIEQGSQLASQSPRRVPVGLRGESIDVGAVFGCVVFPLISWIIGNCEKEKLIKISDNDLEHNKNVQGQHNEDWKKFLSLDDNLGVKGIKLAYKEMTIEGSGFANSAISYSATWKEKGTRPVAVFATSIRSNEGKSRADESSYSFQKLQDLTKSYSSSYFEQQKKVLAYKQYFYRLLNDFMITVDVTTATFDKYSQERETEMRKYRRELFTQYAFTSGVAVLEKGLNNATKSGFNKYFASLQFRDTAFRKIRFNVVTTEEGRNKQLEDLGQLFITDIITLDEARTYNTLLNNVTPLGDTIELAYSQKFTVAKVLVHFIAQEIFCYTEIVAFGEYLQSNNITVEEVTNTTVLAFKEQHLQGNTTLSVVDFDKYLLANNIKVEEALTVETKTDFKAFLQAKMRYNRQELFNQYVLDNDVTVEEALANATLVAFEYLQANNVTVEETLTNTTLVAFDEYLQDNDIRLDESISNVTKEDFNWYLWTMMRYNRQELFREYVLVNNVTVKEVTLVPETILNLFAFDAYLSFKGITLDDTLKDSDDFKDFEIKDFNAFVQKKTKENSDEMRFQIFLDTNIMPLKVTINRQELFHEYVQEKDLNIWEALKLDTAFSFHEYLQNANTIRLAFESYLQANSIALEDSLTDSTKKDFNQFVRTTTFIDVEEETPDIFEYREDLFINYLKKKDIVLEEPPPLETIDEYWQRVSAEQIYSISLVNNIPFGLSDDYSSAGVIAMSNFGEVRTNS